MASVWVLAGFLAFWSSPALETDLAQAKAPGLAHAQRAAVIGGLHATSEALGVQALHRSIDALTAPLDRPARVLKEVPRPAPTMGVQAVPPPVDGTPERPVLPTRWPHRILLAGASSVQGYLGSELERRLETYEDVEVHREGRLGTGLNRDDVFDWPARIAQLQAEVQPDVVIVQFGGNDAQPITLPDGQRIPYGREGWNEEYARRVSALTRQIREAGAVPVFLGMSIVRKPDFWDRLQRLNEVVEAAVTEAGGRYVPTWDLSASPEGAYQAEIRFHGRSGLRYLGDGVHFSRLGAQSASELLSRRLEQEIRLVPQDPELGPSLRFDLDSSLRAEPTSYLVYLPRELPAEGVPVLLLLHGAWGSWRDWPEHDHVALQRLAQAHALAIVTPDGRDHGWYVDSPLIADHQLHSYFTEELLPDVALHVPTTGRVAVAGLSMGGHGALNLALRHPGRFTSVSSMSGVTDLVEAQSREALQAALGPYTGNEARWESWSVEHQVRAAPALLRGTPVRLSIGTEDKWLAANERLDALLTAEQIDHVYEALPGGHTWDFWTARLPEHVAWHAQYLHAP